MSKDVDFPQKPLLTWVIRTYNEEKWLDKVLNALFMQSRLDFEVIIVDSESTDSTLDIIKKYPIRKLISIKKRDFHYSYALNLGISEARGELIGIISGHSLPSHRFWYEWSIKHFSNPKVAAVGGQFTSLPDGSYQEKLGDIQFHTSMFKGSTNKFDSWQSSSPFKAFTNTNSMIRKSCWKQYPFDESVEASEDYDWCIEMLSRGYDVVFEPNFNVYHSHGGLEAKTLHNNWEYWQKINKIHDRKSRPSKSIHSVKL